MNTKKKSSFAESLKGMGLNTFGADGADDFAAMEQATPKKGDGTMIDVALIDPAPHQTRRKFKKEKIQELADTIAAEGMLQPVVIRINPDQPGRYFLIAGERRLRAHKLMEWGQIEAIVREPKANASAALTLIENVQREDLDPYEVALGIQAVIDERGSSYAEIAKSIGKSKTWVSQHAAILRMPEVLQEAIQSGGLQDYTTIAATAKLYESFPAQVVAAVQQASSDAPFSRSELRRLEAALKDPVAAVSQHPAPVSAAAAFSTETGTAHDGGNNAPVSLETAQGAEAASTAPGTQPASATEQQKLPASTQAPAQSRPRPVAARVIVAAIGEETELGYLDLADVLADGQVTVRKIGNGPASIVAADTLRILRIER